MYCSATATMPLPPVSSSTPTTAAPPSCRAVILNGASPFLMTRNPPSSTAADTNRRAPLSMGGMVSMTMAMPR
jgi:hypothetical protein